MIELDIIKRLRSSEGIMDLHVKTELGPGKITALYGVSGAGKTSLLRMIAGLMTPDDGIIRVNGKTWFDRRKKVNLTPQRRELGFVFQDFALFPNLTVEGNLKFALPKSADKAIINELLELFSLEAFRNEKPGMLSGGQKQRVALARSIVQSPPLLLLDEPLSALDHALRLSLQEYLVNISRTRNCTIFIVSHDMGEIFRIAHDVIVLDGGQVVRQGAPGEVFSGRQVSGKFRFTGEILSIVKEDIIYVASVLIGTDLVKIVIDPSETENLKVGDRVLVASKAFNPIIQRIS